MRRPWKHALTYALLAQPLLWVACRSLDGLSGTDAPPDGGSEASSELDGDARDGSAGDSSSASDATTDAATSCDAAFASDRDHCGRCGHSCLGGDCVDGGCVSFALVTGEPSSVRRIAIENGDLYFTNDAAEVRRCKSSSCANPLAIATALGSPLDLTVDATRIIVADANGRILIVPKVGGAAVPLVTGQDYPDDLASDGTFVYYTEFNLGTIKRCALAGCANAPTRIAHGRVTPFDLVVDGTFVYWLELSAGTISRTPKGTVDGGTFLSLVPVQSGLDPSLAANTASLFWSTGQADGDGGLLRRAAKDGTNLMNIGSYAGHADSVVADEKAVYVATDKGIFAADGVGAARRLASANFATAIAQDAVAIYWVENTAIWKVAK